MHHHVSGAMLRRMQPAPATIPPTSVVDFSSFSAGDIITDIAPGINVTAFKRMANRSLEIADAMVFDTTSPSGQDYDLGSPHQVFGGPGVGKGGNDKSLFPNDVPQGNVLILSTDGDSSDPDDHGFGGFFMFSFDPPLDIAAIGVLDNEGKAWIQPCNIITSSWCVLQQREFSWISPLQMADPRRSSTTTAGTTPLNQSASGSRKSSELS